MKRCARWFFSFLSFSMRVFALWITCGFTFMGSHGRKNREREGWRQEREKERQKEKERESIYMISYT